MFALAKKRQSQNLRTFPSAKQQTAQADIKAVDIKTDGVKENMGLLKEEGCLPARMNDKSIGKIEIRLESIDGRLNSIDKSQTAGFKAIMEKLAEK